MIRHLVFALFAAFVLGASAANALPGFDPSDIGDIGEILDPCSEFPGLCDPIDPCELNPGLCDPPVDPCELAPVTCGEEPPVAQPEEPPVFPHAAILTGSAKVKGDGFKTTQAFEFFMVFNDTAFTAFDDKGQSYAGHLAPKGTSGAKFQIFLDEASSDGLSTQIAGRAAEASGRSAGAVLGESAKLILKLRPDGSALLKIKSEVLVTGLGEVTFKANVTGLVSSD
jgi:hypothetical protein